MNKTELKKLIAECVVEVIQEQGVEEGWFGDTMKKVGKGLGITGGGPDTGAAHYDRYSKMHNKRADFKNASPEKQQKLKQAAGEKVENLKTKFDSDLKKAMRDAFIEGESVGMTRQEIKQVFFKSMMGILNQYKRLEEEWGKKE